MLQICKYHIILPEMCIYVRYLLHPLSPNRGVKYDEPVHEIFCTLSVAVAPSSCDDNAVCYVDSMTSCLLIMGHMCVWLRGCIIKVAHCRAELEAKS